ncbi:hypothetical protein C0995_011303 [Termitomyces sp. Mi166|nr:hypothetical protein C0995_011303 [Termitomyces sp. Mi166\
MPSDQSTWLIAVPNDGEAEGLTQELHSKLSQQSKFTGLAQFEIPPFKTGTLDSLIALSEDIPKQDVAFTATVAKTVDTLRSLLNNDPAKLVQHILIDEKGVDDYLLTGWRWDEGRYNVQKSLREIVDSLCKDLTSIDNAMKAKLNNYNLVKGSLTQLQRKKLGNLSVRSLADLVSKDDFIQDSDHLETLLVAVPRALVKDWNLKYEKLGTMVVPRSSRLIASDDDFSLFGVVVFKRTHDEFAQGCRENKFILRDFVYSEEEVVKQQEELLTADTTEKELWTELLRLSRTNFSESFKILVHLKVVRLFVESVLRYGLPANYLGLIIKPDPKVTKKTFNLLQVHFTYLSPRSNRSSSKGSRGEGEEYIGEYQSLMDQEFFDFVLFEVPWIVY